MKSIISIFIFAISFQVFAKEKGLPYEPDTTKINLTPISRGKELNLKFRLVLPATQGLNHGAPSFVAVFEKTKKSDWVEVQRWDLNQVFATGDEIQMTKNVLLSNDDSEIAVHSTVYHCGKDHKTACYIQGYLGKIQRDSKLKAVYDIDFLIQAHMN